MPDLPARPDLDQLRHQAKDLLREARAGDPAAQNRLRAVSTKETLSAAQSALAREYGFSSWPKLKREVERRQILDDRDLEGLLRLLEEDSALATTEMEHWCDHPQGASPLGYLAMLPYDTARSRWRNVPGTGALAHALIAAGAAVNGQPGASETPLITAASYGDAEVAQALIDAGADLEARSSPDAGGVPGGTALLHAAVFGMTDVVDVLVAAGARVEGIEVAAAAGDVTDFLTGAPPEARIRALVMASSHERLEVIDQLIAAGTPVDAVDEAFGGHPLREAAAQGRPASVQRLLVHGADPNLRDEQGRSALDHLRRGRAGNEDTERFDLVDGILAPLTKVASSLGRTTRRQDPVLTVTIDAIDFPGRSCGPGPRGEVFRDIHVGLARRSETVELAPGDSHDFRWTFDVTVKRDDVGRVVFGGPHVLGSRDDRHFGLRWVTLTDEDELEVFRAAKLRIGDIDQSLIEEAVTGRQRLVGRLAMTDTEGLPICSRVRPPWIEWSGV
jgi:ankyrin repeat protein